MSEGRGDFITVNGSRLVEDTRSLLAGLAWMLAWVEAGGRDDAAVADFDPMSLGRELLEAIPRLVEAGQVELGALVDAVRQEILETAVAATFSERLQATLEGLDAGELQEMVRTISNEILLAQVVGFVIRDLERAQEKPEKGDSEGEAPVVEEPAEVWEVEVDRGRVLRQFRRAQEPLVELVLELDQRERDEGGFGDAEPYSFGRWLLGGVLRLVEEGTLSAGVVEGALRSGEHVGEARRPALSTAEDLARVLCHFDRELATARVFLDRAKQRDKSFLRSREGRAVAAQEFRGLLQEMVQDVRRRTDAS